MSKRRRGKRNVPIRIANPERVQADQERRRSGAALPHGTQSWSIKRKKVREQLKQMGRCEICDQ